MGKGYVVGLRIFLIVLLRLISDGEQITVEEVQKRMPNGIATELAERYILFKEFGFKTQQIKSVDRYYSKKYTYADESDIEEKYACSLQQGLSYLIAIALDDL